MFLKFLMNDLNSLVDLNQMLDGFFGHPRLRLVELTCFRINQRKNLSSFVVNLLSVPIFIWTIDDRRVYLLDVSKVSLELDFLGAPGVLFEPL